MIAEYLYRKRKGLEHSQASQRKQQFTIVGTGVLLAVVNIATLLATLLHTRP